MRANLGRRGCVVIAIARGFLCCAAPMLFSLDLGGCSDDKSKRTTVAPVVRDVPEPLRGTIGSVATIRGVDPQLVSGLGLVVGLNGTGGGDIAPQIQATMERELARGGIGKGGVMDSGPLAGRSPRQVLRDPNVAVVIVEAAVSPGWPRGYTFDVRVRALPGSTVTSLEGGQLWTTELRVGPAATLREAKARRLGQAWGPVFINPFAAPGRPGADAVTRTVGRVLGGGELTEPLQLELVLDNPSHSIARSITGSINARFPDGPGDDGPTARGRNADSIAVRVPRAWAERPNEFIELLRCTRIDQSFPQEYARRDVEYLKQYPVLADDIGQCLQAIGKSAVPFLPPMYDYPELAPRLAALRAGAKLGDPRTAPYLIELAKTGPAATRTEAIELLGRLSANPRINLALWELVDDRDLDVRVAAYEALAERNDWGIMRTEVDGRFEVDVVPAREGLIYVTQQGRPRIVAFGGGGSGADPGAPGKPAPTGLRLRRPLLVSAWDDRLMLAADGETDPVRLRYQDFRSGRTTTLTVADTLSKLTDLLGHKPTPEDDRPGLGLPYSEVVGALYELQRQGAVDAAFATERDKLQAGVLRASHMTTITERPEVTGQEPPPQPTITFRPEAADEAGAKAARTPGAPPSLVVPLNPPTEAKPPKKN